MNINMAKLGFQSFLLTVFFLYQTSLMEKLFVFEVLFYLFWGKKKFRVKIIHTASEITHTPTYTPTPRLLFSGDLSSKMSSTLPRPYNSLLLFCDGVDLTSTVQ